MKQADIIKSCVLLVSSNKGISLEEEYALKGTPRVTVKGNKNLNSMELVQIARTIIFRTLGRSNVTPRDLKKAIINLIEL